MTIDDLKARKVMLSSAIHTLIREFEEETSLTVERVELEHGFRHATTPVLIEVKLEVQL